MKHITTKELILSDIATHGIAWTAKRYAKKMPFTIFHFLAFGYLPRAILTRIVVQVDGSHYPIKVSALRVN